MRQIDSCPRRITLCVVLAVAILHSHAAASRVSKGLQVLYAFDEGKGQTIRDQSGIGQPLDLRIKNPSAIDWRSGALAIRGKAKILSDGAATKLIDSIRRTHSLTIEAWLRPESTKQSGPARIVSMSADATHRNFTLGQDGSRFDVRLRARSTSENGLPSLASAKNAARTRLTHVVYTRDYRGRSRIYVDGRQQTSDVISGNLGNWDQKFSLSLADEVSGGRPWKGEFHLVAIYNRALSQQEVTLNFHAGAEAESRPEPLVARSEGQVLFESKVAPLLAERCLDCHDSASKKGRLDLSRKLAAFAGGESGKVIQPGNAAESLLWQQVESGDMPPDGAPLSEEDREALKRWLNAGAAWTLDEIDPVVYAHSNSAGISGLRRLTVGEYVATVKAAVGVDVTDDARRLLPPDLRADGFSNTAYNLNVDLKHVEAYSRLAEMIVGRMDVLEFAQRFSKSRKLSTDDTMRDFVESMGSWIMRGPLEEREVSNYSGIATTVASAGGSYQEAVTYILEAMLQSPRFIYRVEYQLGDGDEVPVNSYELASRMSYTLWGAPPDSELMKAAESGDLLDREFLRGQVRRMLGDPRAVSRSAEFITEWLNLNRLTSLQPNQARFPGWQSALGGDMRDETLAFFHEIVWTQKRPLADLLNAQFTYLTPRLAKHYGIEPKARGNDLARYDLTDVPSRGGLLTQGSILTIGGDDASMVTRGLFVLHDLLRGTVKDPPPGLDTTPVPSKPGVSQRHISEERISSISCGGCHVRFEPLAFGLEKFDGLGSYRENDEFGNPMREDGEILIPGAAEPVEYKTSAELMGLLAQSPRVQETITWKLAQFALGRPLVPADIPIVNAIHDSAQQAGGTYAAVMTELVMSDLIHLTRTERSE